MIVEEVGDPAPNNPAAVSFYPATKAKYTNGEERTLTKADPAHHQVNLAPRHDQIYTTLRRCSLNVSRTS